MSAHRKLKGRAAEDRDRDMPHGSRKSMSQELSRVLRERNAHITPNAWNTNGPKTNRAA